MPQGRSSAFKRGKPPVLALTNARLRRWPLPVPSDDADKEARGRVLVIGGARQMPGAAVLAATAVLRAGAGKLQIATVQSAAPLVATAMPESFVHALPEAEDGGLDAAALEPLVRASEQSGVILLGPGMVENPALETLVIRLLRGLAADRTVVLDACALTALARRRADVAACKPTLIATPHAGEMAALLGRHKTVVQRQFLSSALNAAKQFGAIVVLKGAQTLVTDGTTVYCNTAGNVGLATSGSGDVLAGIVAGLAARGATPLQAAAWGVFLHAKAGDVLAKRIGPLGYLARELAPEIPALMAHLQ